MKCNKWPIEVNGHQLLIDRAFDGSPAIYHATRISIAGHIDEKVKSSMTFPASDDMTFVIICHLEPPAPEEKQCNPAD